MHPMPPPPRQGSGGKCLLGCGLIFVLLLVACGGGIWYAYQYGAQLLIGAGGELARAKIVEGIERSELREEDKQVIIEQVDRVIAKAKEGKINGTKLAEIMENLKRSPLLQVAMAYSIEENCVRYSGLDADEKQAASLTLQRAARGLFEQRISNEQLKAAMRPIANEKPDGELELKEHATDDEIRQALADLGALADDAGIPEEPFEVDIGAEVKKAVDEALGES
jgi:hypothetical protein